MDGELALVREVVNLSPEDALEQAEAFLTRQGYTTVRRAGNSLTVERRAPDQPVGQQAPKLTVTAVPQPRGGVRIKVKGNDREGVQERQAEWAEWAENLPKKKGGINRRTQGPAAHDSDPRCPAAAAPDS